MMRALRFAVLTLALALACGAKAPPVEGLGSPVAAADAGAAAPQTCRANSDCGAGLDCIGPAGCEVAWTCQPARACTMDAVEYCSCEGKRLIGSSRCPPAPYSHRGACP